MTQAGWLETLTRYWDDVLENGAYQKIIQPNQNLLIAVMALVGVEAFLQLLPSQSGLRAFEILISLILAVSLVWLISQLFKRIFDFYILDAAIRSGRKIDNAILILIKLAVNLTVAIVTVIVFAQTHQINILGIVASLGIGGLAVAFAAQKVLEQVLGGIVIYLDRPFVLDDYIGLPDGTFGRVESIGLRSTKIRTSGRGTVMIVPNSALIQANIENFTGAKKVMSLLHILFHEVIDPEQLALIRQIIKESTKDIFGIDTRNTEISFTTVTDSDGFRTQAQITFFILGSGDVSMELRRQLLGLATDNVTLRLEEYGVAFDVTEPTVYIDAPITI
ncbi:MAG: hypothetical protein Kow00121_38190 [Elainellaceae cyanobacterium]